MNNESTPGALGSNDQLEPGACICRTWCRSDLGGVVIGGRRYPGPNHADGCPAQIRHPFTVLEYDGGRVVMEPHEAAEMQADAPGMYAGSTVLLTRDQFDRMPEFPGF